MNLRSIRIVYRKELLDSLRDRRTLISMIVVPVLVMPLFTIGMGSLTAKLLGKAMQEVPTVMILGGEDSPKAMAGLKQLHTITIVPPSPDYADQITNKKIRAAVQIPKDFDAALERGEPTVV